VKDDEFAPGDAPHVARAIRMACRCQVGSLHMGNHSRLYSAGVADCWVYVMLLIIGSKNNGRFTISIHPDGSIRTGWYQFSYIEYYFSPVDSKENE
jgi:hypothetical protein